LVRFPVYIIKGLDIRRRAVRLITSGSGNILEHQNRLPLELGDPMPRVNPATTCCSSPATTTPPRSSRSPSLPQGRPGPWCTDADVSWRSFEGRRSALALRCHEKV